MKERANAMWEHIYSEVRAACYRDPAQALEEVTELVDSHRELRAFRAALIECAYIEDCHITGTHNPEHTTEYICSEQLTDLAKRVCTVLYGVKWPEGNQSLPYTQANKIQRRINRMPGGWWGYYKCHGKEDAAILEHWEKAGFGKPRPKKVTE